VRYGLKSFFNSTGILTEEEGDEDLLGNLKRGFIALCITFIRKRLKLHTFVKADETAHE